MADEWGLVAPFLTDDPVFARGVRYGMLYMRLKRTRKRVVAEMVTEQDEEAVRLMAGRLGWAIRRRRSLAGGWVGLVFVRV